MTKECLNEISPWMTYDKKKNIMSGYVWKTKKKKLQHNNTTEQNIHMA